MLATTIGFFAVLLWSCLAVLTTLSGPVPPFELAALTFTIGGSVGLAVTVARGRLKTLCQPATVWAVGVGGLFGYHAFYFSALQAAPAAQAGLIAYLWPLLIVLMSALLPGERLIGRHVVGAVLGLAAVALLLLGDRRGAFFSPCNFGGYALAGCCAVVWSGYSVLSRRMRNVPTDAVSGFCLVTALLAGVTHILVEPAVLPLAPAQWLAIVGLGLGPVGLAFYVWDYGVKHGDLRLLGVASYAAPVLSTLILVGAGAAPATWTLALACALIAIGAAVAGMPGRKSEAPQQSIRLSPAVEP